MRLVFLIACAFVAGRSWQRHIEHRAVVRKRLREIGGLRLVGEGQ